MSDVVTIFQTLGFPVGMVIICVWFIKHIYDIQSASELKAIEREEARWDKLAKLTEAVNENSRVLRMMVDRLEPAAHIQVGDNIGKED